MQQISNSLDKLEAGVDVCVKKAESGIKEECEAMAASWGD
jgi:hypothetical protein